MERQTKKFNNNRSAYTKNKSFSQGPRRNNDGRRPVEMHDAVCDKCKQDCQVPFKPSQDKPVLCKECFTKENPRSNNSRGPRNNFNGPRNNSFRNNNSRNDGPREMHDAVCDKCKKNCQVPFKPTQGKPILCSDCFKQSR